jgi:hypothetical protein
MQEFINTQMLFFRDKFIPLTEYVQYKHDHGQRAQFNEEEDIFESQNQISVDAYIRSVYEEVVQIEEGMLLS